MISRKDLIVAILCTFCLTMVLFTAAPVKSTGSSYDPWVDVNHDGKINVLDLIKVALSTGTTGDPALNVNVANWPNSTETVVWNGSYVTNSPIDCYPVSAKGFAHLNVYVMSNLALQTNASVTITISVYGAMLYIPTTHPGFYPILVYTTTLNLSRPGACFSIPVPGQYFYFQAVSNTHIPYMVYLSYYLTWG